MVYGFFDPTERRGMTFGLILGHFQALTIFANKSNQNNLLLLSNILHVCTCIHPIGFHMTKIASSS
jgi:hypothetical protein